MASAIHKNCESYGVFERCAVDFELSKILGQDVHEVTDWRLTLELRNAFESGRVETVKLLLKNGRADPSDQDNAAIVWASRNGHAEVVEMLLQDERVLEKIKNERIEQLDRPLGLGIAWASRRGDVRVVELLLEHERFRPSTYNSALNLALVWASRFGRVQVVKLLLEDGRADSTANRRDHTEVVKLLEMAIDARERSAGRVTP